MNESAQRDGRPRLRLMHGGLSQSSLSSEWRALGDRIIDCTAVLGLQLASGRWSRVASLIECRRELLSQLQALSSDAQSRRCVAALEAAILESENMIAKAAAARVGAGSATERAQP